MHGILGITILTFRHCVRSRAVLLGVVAYVFVMALTVALTPRPETTEPAFTSSEGGRAFDAEQASLSPDGFRIRSMEATSVNVAIFLGFALTALVAATWLPSQVRGGELTFVLSKPVGRVGAVIGSLLGFWLMLLTLLAVCALCGIGALRLAAATTANARDASTQLETMRTSGASGFDVTGGKAEEAHAELTSPSHQAVWQFGALSFRGRSLEGGAMRCRFVAEIARADNEFITHTDLLVSLIDPRTGNAVEQIQIANAKSGQVVEFAIPARKMPAGDFAIAVAPKVPGYRVICDRRWLRVVTGMSGFEWNYVKAFALAFMGLAVFVSLTVAGSTFLTANVSIFFATGAGAAGACIGFFREYLRTLYSAALNSATLAAPEGRHAFFTHVRAGTDALGESISLTVYQTVSSAFNSVIFSVVPDWNLFNGVNFLMARTDLPGAAFLSPLFYAAIYCAACIVVAAFAFGRRELK